MRFFLFIFIVFVSSCQREDIVDETKLNLTGENFIDSLEISQGGFLSPSDLENKIIVLNIWADWCPPCIIEMPYFNKLDKKPNVKVLGFHFDQFDVLEENELLLLIEKLGIDFANLKTDPRDIWGIEIPENVPTTLIIKDNEIVKTLITPQTYESLLEAVEI